MIRTAQVSDAREIAALTRELGYPADECVLAGRLANLLPKDDQLLIVAATGDQLDGWLQAHVSETLESGVRVEIVGLIVAQKSRRCGIGRALVAAAEQWAGEKRAEAIVVRSNQLRAESHHFYPALGFALSKVQKVYRKLCAF
jgi:GNAT superfamily N-acetyltransferase